MDRHGSARAIARYERDVASVSMTFAPTAKFASDAITKVTRVPSTVDFIARVIVLVGLIGAGREEGEVFAETSNYLDSHSA